MHDVTAGDASAVFHADQHLCRSVFAPMAALQILAIPLGIAVVCALPQGQIRTLHKRRSA
jgi:hypothetical protein